MKRKPRGRVDPIERRIEAALNPGVFIRDGEDFSFVSGLEAAAAEIAGLIPTEPARAAALYETFFAGCYEKADELDDSSGSFGQFAQDLVCGWIKARQAAGADPDETAATILAWMDDDSYGFCYGIENDAVKAFDKAGLAAFEKQVRARFEAAAEHVRRHWSGVLRAIYLAQRNIAAYVALAGETGLTPEDCLSLAELLAKRKPDEALGWIDRGIGLHRTDPHACTARYDLARLQRELLTRLGRGDEALEAAWADFREHPSKLSYDDFMKFVPKAGRAAWHEKAMDAAQGADLDCLLELFVETKDLERLAGLVLRTMDDELEGVSHYATEPAAKKLEKNHPDLAARLWRAQAMRIVDAGKSRYYDAALSNFERARRCYERAGLPAEWEATVRCVCADHYRKTGFMPGFKALVAGSGNVARPSFLELAKAHWHKRRKRTEL